MDEEQPDELKKLYDDFVDALRRGADMSAFSKDDLLDIYDYSRGIPDDYVGLEALLVGMRFYPRSRDMRKRIALYMHDLGQDDLAERAAERLPDSSVIRLCNRITGLEALPDDRARFEALFSGVSKNSLEDGDLLYIIDMLNAGGHSGLVEKYCKEIATLCQYPTTVYHELYRIALDSRDYQRALDYAVRLTEMEPFNLRFWIDLANLQNTTLGDPQASLETIEYALAIDPDSTEAMLSKANALYNIDIEASRGIIHKLMEKNPEDASTLYFYAHLEFLSGHEENAVEVLRRYRTLVVEPDRDYFDTIFTYGTGVLPADIRQDLVKFVSRSSADGIAQWCADLFFNKVYGGVIELVSTGLVNLGDDSLLLMVCEAYFRRQSYDELMQLVMRQRCQSDDPSDLPLHFFYVYLLGLIVIGQEDKIEILVGEALRKHGDDAVSADLSPASRLMCEASKAHIVRILEYVRGAGAINADDINLFLR